MVRLGDSNSLNSFYSQAVIIGFTNDAMLATIQSAGGRRTQDGTKDISLEFRNCSVSSGVSGWTVVIELWHACCIIVYLRVLGKTLAVSASIWLCRDNGGRTGEWAYV
jgi:hypothetical protein